MVTCSYDVVHEFTGDMRELIVQPPAIDLTPDAQDKQAVESRIPDDQKASEKDQVILFKTILCAVIFSRE